MATLTLIVVIVLLTCNAAILYLPFDKHKRSILSWVVAGVLAVCCLAQNAWNNEIPVLMREKVIKLENVSVQKSMMATFNVSEEKLNPQTEMPTPIELGGTILLVFALVFTPLLVHVAKFQDDNEAKEVHQWALTLCIAACVYLLSLYYGLKLAVMPFYNKVLGKDKTSPALT